MALKDTTFMQKAILICIIMAINTNNQTKNPDKPKPINQNIDFSKKKKLTSDEKGHNFTT